MTKHAKKEHKHAEKPPAEKKPAGKKPVEDIVEGILNTHNYFLEKPDSVVDQETGVEEKKKRILVTGYGGTVTATLNREIRDEDVLGQIDDSGKIIKNGIVFHLTREFGSQIRVEYQNKKITINNGESSKDVGILIVSRINQE